MAERIKLVAFMLMEDEYGFEIDCVQEVRRVKRITRVPQAPAFVEGVIKLRGKVVPILDLRKRLGLPAKGHGKRTRIIIVKAQGHTLGVVVDSATEVLTVPVKDIDLPDSSILANAVFLKGVAKIPGRMVLVANIGNILTAEEKKLLPAAPHETGAAAE